MEDIIQVGGNMKPHNAAFKKFIRKSVRRNQGYIRKKEWNDSNNDRKRRHEQMMRTCYWKWKYYEVTGKEW